MKDSNYSIDESVPSPKKFELPTPFEKIEEAPQYIEQFYSSC
jgi:hypothetical protein